MMALSRPEVDLIAVTCVSGNVEVDQVAINTLRVLEVCERLDVSIYSRFLYNFSFQVFTPNCSSTQMPESDTFLAPLGMLCLNM